MSKPKFDKEKCLKCIFHQEVPIMGYPVDVDMGDGRVITKHPYCNYASVTRQTCLRKGPNGSIIDIRDNGIDGGCAIFIEGRALPSKQDCVVLGKGVATDNVYK